MRYRKDRHTGPDTSQRGRLIDEEYTVIKEHPPSGEKYSKRSPSWTRSGISSCTITNGGFERDGPDGLTGKEIPRLSRILSVADAFDAMITDRPYRDALSVDVAIDELYKNTDSQFDKDVVGIFVSAYCGTC